MISNLLGQRTVGRRAFALFLLVLFFGLQALAVSPALHARLHHDADKADHECAVTMFAHGKLQIASSPLVLVAPPYFIDTKISEPVSPSLEISYRLLPGRAPPRLPA